MMDRNFLRELGWSDELIEAAERVASAVSADVEPSFESPEVHADFGGTVISSELDLSGTVPVGGAQLLVTR